MKGIYMINIFISHAWKYSKDYYTIKIWLDASYLVYHNYSIPEHDPLDANNTKKLKEQLTEQIRHASVVIIIAGMYTNHSYWIQHEIDEAVRMGKKIIAIKPRGNTNMPTNLQNVAHEIINWNSQSLLSAIYRCTQ